MLVLLEELGLAGAPFGPLAGAGRRGRDIEYGQRAVCAANAAAIGRGEATLLAGL